VQHANAAELYLQGIGYREQELQVAKGQRFESEVPSGVQWASFAGGTHIFIKGVGLAEAPEANSILLESNELSATIPGPPMTEADIFNS